MTELFNTNLHPNKEPEYFYLVSEFVTTFGKDAGKQEPFSNDEIFKAKDLKTARIKANSYFDERMEKVDKGEVSYFLPFDSPDEFEFGKNASYSITIYLVEHYSDNEEYLHPVRGEDEESMAEGLETEQSLFNK